MSAVDLLQIENDPHLLTFRFQNDDFLMWPIIRTYILQDIIQKRFSQKYPLTNSPRLMKRDIAPYTFGTLKGLINLFSCYDYLVFNKLAGCSLKKEGKWFNRISDYFIETQEKTLVLDHSFNFNYKHPRYPKYTASHDLIKIIADIYGKICSNVTTKDLQTIRQLLLYLKTHCQISLEDDFCNFLEKLLLKTSLRLKHAKPLYVALFNRTKPKILFMEDASYGVESYIIKWAKGAGITVAEFQHGMVSSLYPAYCYGKAIHDSPEYKQYLPDYFLTYGQYWSDVINYPAKIVTIGNPHITTTISKLKSKCAKYANGILIATDPGSPQQYANLAIELANRLDDRFTISVKTHPLETPFLDERYPMLRNHPRINLVPDGDIYEHLSDNQYCISSFSTVLFEALALNKIVFLFDNEYTNIHVPSYVGTRFRDTDQLIALLSEEKKQFIDSNYFFNRKWKENYSSFLSTAR